MNSSVAGRKKRLLRRVLRASLLASLLASSLVVPGTSGAAEPERSLANPTGWWWYTGVDEPFITDKINNDDARIIDIEVQSASPYKFSVAMVHNSGVHAKGWWWYFGLTADELGRTIDSLSARILDLETYVVDGQRRFAVVLVPNTGPDAKAWWWYYNVKASFVADKITENAAHLIDIDTYKVGDKRRYAVVMVDDQPGDPAWWWYYNVSPSFIADKLEDKNARLVDIEKHGDNTFTVVMERNTGKYWWWWYGGTMSKINQVASQNGARIIDIERYKKNDKTRFAAIFLNNANSETTRLREIMRPGLEDGSFGIYLKEAAGPVFIALQENTIFEPASTLKVLHHAYAMRRVQDGLDDLGNDFHYFAKPDDPTNKDICPKASYEVPANRVDTTLEDGLTRMMQVSDNRTTRGMEIRYGRANINAFAAAHGMSGTEIRQRIGCGRRDGLFNDLTLADAGRLYEGVVLGNVLTGTERDKFYEIMLGGPIDSNGSIADLVREEAADLGKSAATAEDFIDLVEARSKGGSYDICVPTGCSDGYEYIRTVAGRLSLPFKAGERVRMVDYLYGRFVEKLNIPCSPKGGNETEAQVKARCATYKKAAESMGKAAVEMWRKRIREALMTW